MMIRYEPLKHYERSIMNTTKSGQRLFVALIVACVFLFGIFFISTCQLGKRDLNDIYHGTNPSIQEEPYKRFEQIVDVRLCQPDKPLAAFVYDHSHGAKELQKAMNSSEYVTRHQNEACLFMTVVKGGSGLPCLSHWPSTEKPSQVLISLDNNIDAPSNAVNVVPEYMRRFRRGIDILADANTVQQTPDSFTTFTIKREFEICDLRSDSSPTAMASNIFRTVNSSEISHCNFTLGSTDHHKVSDIIQILRASSIPILYRSSAPLPFDEIINWDYVAVFIYKEQLPSLKAIVGLVTDDERFHKRRHGRSALLQYLNGPEGFVRGLMNTLSLRLGLPSHSPSFPITLEHNNENIEQFTAVMMTFKRDKFLLKTLKTLSGLQELRKDHVPNFLSFTQVLIIWNDIERQIPKNFTNVVEKLNLTVHFIHPPMNSINNRFAFFNKIDTDCVLQLDDDLKTSHKELKFMFRAWREERDRLVSFVPRRRIVDAKTGLGKYDYSQHGSHELGLTGYAMMHKKYLIEYAKHMPAMIRDFVDEHHNCEDIAMNYLIAHRTRKAVIKIGNKGKLDYATNSAGISSKGDHLKHRHMCIQLFDRIYGYSPLVQDLSTIY